MCLVKPQEDLYTLLQIVQAYFFFGPGRKMLLHKNWFFVFLASRVIIKLNFDTKTRMLLNSVLEEMSAHKW